METRATQLGTSEVYVSTHVALGMAALPIIPASIFWSIKTLNWLATAAQPGNCINIRRHVALLSGPMVHSLYSDNSTILKTIYLFAGACTPVVKPACHAMARQMLIFLCL